MEYVDFVDDWTAFLLRTTRTRNTEWIASSNKLQSVGVFVLIIMSYGDDYETQNKTLNQIINDVKYGVLLCEYVFQFMFGNW